MRAHMIIGAGAAGTQAPGESFPERTIAGIGKDMASRINLLNGQADAARTGVESKMSTYIALYAADDDSLTASVRTTGTISTNSPASPSWPRSPPPTPNTGAASNSCSGAS